MLNKLMYKTLSLLLATSMLVTATPVFAEGEGAPAIPALSEKSVIPAANGVIVKMKEGASVSELEQSLNISISSLSRGMSQISTADESLTLLPVDEEDIPTVLEQLSENEDVLYAQPNYSVALSEIDINQWGLQNVGQSANTMQGAAGYDINVLNAWNITQGSNNIVIGVLDTGIDISHEALADKIWINPNESENGSDEDGNGYIDDLRGWDFVNGDKSVYDEASLDEHGTHVAGIISSVAPNVRLLPLKAFSYNAGYTYDIISAIKYAEAMGVKIINCSFASTEYNQALADVMEQSDMLFVCAAGNYARSTDDLAPFPACYGFPNILSVAAIDSTGALSPISTYGDKIDIAAPGINIYSALPDNKYGFKDGTSMATAYASGAASLVLSNTPDLTVTQIRQTVINSATIPVIMPEGATDSEKLLDVAAAVEYEIQPVENKELMPSIVETQTEIREPSLYPFSFSIINGVCTIKITEDEYDYISIIIQNPSAEKNNAIVFQEENLTGTSLVIPNLSNDVEYVFDIKMINGEHIKNYYGNLSQTIIDTVPSIETYNIYFDEYDIQPEIQQTSVVYITASEKEGIIQPMSAGTKYEVESNNTRALADTTYDDYDTYGYINPAGETDFYKISFSSNGVANFWLGEIPSGCDYDLELRDASGTLSSATDFGVLLGYSCNSGNSAERIRYYPVTAGVTYYVRIYGYSGSSSTAQYKFRAKWYPAPDTYEENNTFSQAKTISTNGSINANINYKTADEADDDYFKFTISTSAIVDITLTNVPSGTDYRFELFDGASDNDWFFSSGTARHYNNERSANTYYIRVYSYSGYSASNYTLTVTTSPINSIGLNNTYNHSMNASNNVYYSFTVNVNTGVKIDLYNFGSSSDYDLYLYKKNGTSWGEVGSSLSTSTSEKIAKSLTSGDYRILVFRYSGSGASYTIKTTSTTTSLAALITSSEFPTTMIAGEQKSVTITVTNIGATAWTSANGFKLGTTLETASFASSEYLLSSTIEYGNSKEFIITLTAPNQTTVDSYDLGWRMKQNALYFGDTLTKSITVMPAPETLSFGSTGKTVSGLTEKWYVLSDLSAGNYVFRTLYTSASFDTTLTLYNSAMSEIAYNDDKYDSAMFSNFSRIEKNLSAGTYYLKVSGHGGTAVTCRVTANSYTDNTLTSSATINNQLEGFYKFTPSSTGTYIISTFKSGSANYDTFLFLLDSSGNRLAYNDDGGDGNYSQISYSLTSGRTYYIRVSSYDYARSGKNVNVTCTLKVAVQSETPPTENQASISITSPTNGSLIKVYNDNTIKVTGTCANVNSVTVSVNNNNLSNTKKSSGSFEASFKPTSSGTYTIKATGVPTYGSTNVVSQISITIAVNDDGDTQAAATAINNGTTRKAAIDFIEDMDFFKFVAPKTSVYYFTVVGSVGTRIILYKQDGVSKILEAYNGQNSVSLQKNQTYYFEVSAKKPSDVGNYQFSINDSKIIRKEYNQESEHPYLNNTYDVRKVSEPLARRIRVHFAYIDTQNGKDYVGLADSYWSGHYTDIWSPWIDDYQVLVSLISDGATTDNGYAIDMIEYEMGIGAFDVVDHIESPHNYPNNYDNTWVISYPGAEKIRVHFSTIQTEANHDFVSTSSGNKWSGNVSDVWSNWIDGDSITINLKSDGSTQGYGFIMDAVEVKKSLNNLN